ncbi:hypothetical protein E8E14_007526 [Neopestalotiopsis sp. 37M]|nr:hypothetical protein E8E14_007526 [Neopestalotiopsis sp. 37M]
MMNYPTMSGPMDVRRESEDVGQHQEVQAAANVHWPPPSSMPATNTPQPHQPLQLPLTSSQMTWDQFQLRFPIPEELIRIPDGSSISEQDAVLAENGRTYHGYKEGKLDFQTQMFIMALDGRLALAPMTASPSLVLDVATGTGIWAIQFAEQNPGFHVVGTDLSAIQPVNRPRNCEFIKTDAEDTWTFPELPKFDYGRDPTVTLQYKTWLIEAGFTDVNEITLDLPGNAWPEDRKLKRIGQYMYTDLYEGVRGAGWQLLRGLGWSPEQVEDLVARFKVDSLNENYRVFYRMYIVYGRKPANGPAQ